MNILSRNGLGEMQREKLKGRKLSFHKKEDIFSDNPVTVITNGDIKRVKRRERI